MKIGVVFTGGTIGSEKNESGYIAVDKDAGSYLLTRYIKQSGNHYEFVVRKPYCILSENLTGDKLEILIRCVGDFIKEETLDGVIVLHGTDTLQYTAAVLSYVFADVSIPIVLVSSNYVLHDERANGYINFYYAVEFIKGAYGTGVYVSYKNKQENLKIHRGTRLQNGIYYDDSVFSIQDKIYGFFDADNYISVEKKEETKQSVTLLPIEYETVRFCPLKNEILTILPYVGMNYPALSNKNRVILHGSYHSGTIGITEELKEFAKEAKALGIPFYLVGLPKTADYYETVKAYEELKIIPLYDTAFISQYCKLWFALSNGFDIKEIMKLNIAFDHV